MSMLQFDENGARHIQRLYSTPDVVQQRAEVLALLAAQPGERVLDVGSGPGFLVASLADAVGAGGAVQGVAGSEPMNAVARDLIGTRPWASIDGGDALELPYPEATFDAAVSTQVYEYVTDIPAALAELRRVLRPGGRALVLDTDWDSGVWHAADRDPHPRGVGGRGGNPGAPPPPPPPARAPPPPRVPPVPPHRPAELPGHLRRAGFPVTRREIVPLFNPTFEPNTYSAMTIETIARFVTGRQGLSAEDVDGWRDDLRSRGEEDAYLFSVNRYCSLAEAV